MKQILILILCILVPDKALSDEISAIEMQQIIRKVEVDGANNFCNRTDLISCLGVTKDQCLSELNAITQFCSAKYLQQLPNLSSTENRDIEIEKGIEGGMQFGQCLLQDYLAYKGVDAEIL